MSFSDMFTPKQSRALDGFQLDPALKQYMAQQRTREFFDRIGEIGQGMIAASSRGASFGNALAQGVNYAAGGGRRRGGRGGYDLLDMMKIQGLLDKQLARREKRQREEQYESDYSTMVGGYDPTSGIDWQTGRVQGQTPTTQMASSGAAPGAPGGAPLGVEQQIQAVLARQNQQRDPQTRTVPGQLGFTPAQQGLLRAAGSEAGMPVLMDRAFDVPKAPNVQTFYDQGTGREYKGQWNSTTQQWNRVGGLKSGGGLTEAQRAHNAEIAQARATLERMGLDKAEITRRTQKATNTGRDNPEYEEGLDRVVRMATDRMVGDDPDYGTYYRRYLGPAPEFSDPAGPKALPPGGRAVPPGLWQQTQDFLFGPGPSAGQPSQGAGTNPQAPRRGGPRGGGRARGRGGAKPIESMSQNEVLDLIYGNRPLSQDEINRLDARLNELGVERQEP